MRRRRRRQPHPLAERELELLRILDLRASIARRVDLIERYQEEISSMYSQSRSAVNDDRAEFYSREAEVLHGRITEAEAAISATLAEIAAKAALIPPSDLAYLGPVQ